MNITRKKALEELTNAVATLAGWREELQIPGQVDRDGNIIPAYSKGVPSQLKVGEVEHFDTDAFRAELLLVARNLEALGESL